MKTDFPMDGYSFFPWKLEFYCLGKLNLVLFHSRCKRITVHGAIGLLRALENISNFFGGHLYADFIGGEEQQFMIKYL